VVPPKFPPAKNLSGTMALMQNNGLRPSAFTGESFTFKLRFRGGKHSIRAGKVSALLSLSVSRERILLSSSLPLPNKLMNDYVRYYSAKFSEKQGLLYQFFSVLYAIQLFCTLKKETGLMKTRSSKIFTIVRIRG
jgi:hypothetical protein